MSGRKWYNNSELAICLLGGVAGAGWLLGWVDEISAVLAFAGGAAIMHASTLDKLEARVDRLAELERRRQEQAEADELKRQLQEFGRHRP